MPTYEYQCSCGVQFDAQAKMQDRTKPKPCPRCGDDANPMLPSTVQGHFKKDVTGPVPQNTGIHDLDTHIDRVIGQSAAQGRAVIEDRVRRKREVLRDNPGVDGHALSRTPDGDYRILGPEEKAVHDRTLAIHNKAMDWKQGTKKSGT